METEHWILEIGGVVLDDLYEDVERVELDLDERMAAELRLFVRTFQSASGAWDWLEEYDFRPWRDVSFSVGFDGAMKEIFRGVVTRVRPVFEPEGAVLEVRAMDYTVLMDREDKTLAWEGKKDSDIAGAILQKYQLKPTVRYTAVVHQAALATIMQRETDMRFLKRLAQRNGFQCYVEAARAFFHNPAELSRAAGPALVFAGGTKEDTTLVRFEADVGAQRYAAAGMMQMDPTDKSKILKTSPYTRKLKKLGKKSAGSFIPVRNSKRSSLLVAGNVATGLPEMNALVHGLTESGEWFVRGEGEVLARLYRRILRPRRFVELLGLGAVYSGMYYLTGVHHILTPHSYVQRIRVARNALGYNG